MRRITLAMATVSAVAFTAAAGSIPAHAAASTPAQSAAGWRSLTYGGERFEVPARWPLRDLRGDPSRCVRFDEHAVYEGHSGPDPSCPSQLLGVTDAIQVEPLDALGRAQAGPGLRAGTIGGQAALLGGDPQTSQRLVAELPGAGVVVTISYGRDPAVARMILASFRATASGSASLSHPSSVTGRADALPPSSRPTPASSSGAGAAAATAGVSAGPVRWTGMAFDACTAPSPDAMAAWRYNSPYRGIGIYIGGINRACGDGYLSSSWVDAEVAAGWNLIPLYVGRQASCADQGGLASISVSGGAGAQGAQAADDAVAQALFFGMGVGSPIYFDMESWNTSASRCSASVVDFISAWDTELVHRGFVPGIYGSAGSGLAQDIAPLFARSGLPSDVDIAEWDGQANTSSAYLSPSAWPDHHRIKQFEGGVTQAFGGVVINVDQDYVDSDVVGNQQPAVSTVSPTAAAVGMTVVVRGRAFIAGRTAVDFGTVPAATVTVLSPYRLLARVPAQSITTVDVTVRTSGGTSGPGFGHRFAYLPMVGAAADTATGGYWVASVKGNVFPFHAAFHGSTARSRLPAPIVGMAGDANTGGYWLVTARGNIAQFDAPWYGSAARTALPAPVRGIAADPATGGYWLVTAKGNVYNYNAPFYGSMATKALPAPVTGIAADPATGGYWLVTANGHVYNYHAPYYGSLAVAGPTAPVTGIAADPATGGYWLTTAAGVVSGYNAPYEGSTAGKSLTAGVIAVTSSGGGYLLPTADGRIYDYQAPFYGSPG